MGSAKKTEKGIGDLYDGSKELTNKEGPMIFALVVAKTSKRKDDRGKLPNLNKQTERCYVLTPG